MFHSTPKSYSYFFCFERLTDIQLKFYTKIGCITEPSCMHTLLCSLPCLLTVAGSFNEQKFNSMKNKKYPLVWLCVLFSEFFSSHIPSVQQYTTFDKLTPSLSQLHSGCVSCKCKGRKKNYIIVSLVS